MHLTHSPILSVAVLVLAAAAPLARAAQLMPLLPLAGPATPAAPEPTTQPTTQSTSPNAATLGTTRESLLAEIAAFDLPHLTYSGESTVRFTSAVQKLPAEKRRRLADAVNELKKLDENAPELATLLPVRWRTLSTLSGPSDENYSVYRELSPDINSASPIRQRAGNLEQAHVQVQSAEDMLRKGQPMEYDPSQYVLSNLLSRYPADPAAAFLLRRRIEAAPPGEQRNSLEQTLLTNFPDTPAVKQHAIQKYLEEGAEPLPLPPEVSAETPKDKPVLIHFWSPTAQGAAHLPTLKSLAEKFNNQVTILCIPLGDPATVKTYCDKNQIPFPQQQSKTAADFAASQGITEAEIPLTYLLSPDGHLSSIRYDTRLEKPLQRLLNPN